MPCDYSKYPKDWKTVIRPRILKRADNKCEFCGAENYAQGWRGDDGYFYDFKKVSSLGKSTDMINRKTIKIVLTISHQDHDITNNCDSNLKALCQKCHLNHDKDHHKKTRLNNKYRNQPGLNL